MNAETENDRSAEDAPLETDGAEHDEPQERAEPETAEDRIAALEREVAELQGRSMRAQADYQNLRRRAAAELEGGIRRRLQPLLEELLLVLDYLDMALAAPTGTDEARNLAVGVEMTRTKLLQALESEEVHVIETDGVFDPELHEAADTREEPGVEPGTILSTVRKGYTWREVVLRHAQVVVAAGPEGGPQAGSGSRPKKGEPEIPTES